jgi:predicted RND superfamily exporter protein
MRALADLLVRKSVAWAIVVATLVVAVLGTVFALRLENDDNLLAFLPRTNPDVATFYDVSHRFGSLDVALVGIGSNEIFTPQFLGKLKALTADLNENTPGVDFVLSLTSVDDFSPDPNGGIDTDYLVHDIPKDAAGMAALRDKVMSRDQIVGNLIAADGQATLLYCSIASGTDPKPVAAAIRAKVAAAFPGAHKYWGGAPFIQSYIYEATEADLRRLTPWACIAIVLIAVASFRDAIGSILALFSTGVGIVTALGIMSACHVKANLVLGSMPVILFSLGSAYPIHLLTRYYTIAGDMGCEGALRHTLVYFGPVVVSTGLVTISGLLSFLAMDIEPMRTFGLFTAIGVAVTLVLAVTFVPAVVRLAGLGGRRNIERRTSVWMARFCTLVARRRVGMGIVLGLVALTGAAMMLRLDTRIDAEAFFSADSPPAEASRFLHDHFGGGQFFQVQIAGDMTDPAVLREVRAAADRIALLPHVASVNHVGNVVSKINEAMDGDERIPDTTPRLKALYGLLSGKKAVRTLVTDDRAFALMHVKVDTERAALLETVEADVDRVLAESLPVTYETADVAGTRKAEATARLTAEAADRLLALSKQFGAGPLPARADAEAALANANAGREGGTAEARERAAAGILAYIRSDEFTGDLGKSPAGADSRIASALAGLPAGASREAVSQAIASAIEKPSGDPAAADLVESLDRASAQIRSRIAAGAGAQAVLAQLGLVAPPGAKGVRFGTALGNALLDLQAPSVALPAQAGTRSLTTRITGMPVLNHGLSRSVAKNQVKSFGVAMGLVLVIALFLYRSLWSALLAVSPMALTLLVVYGGMGLLGVRLDIGTSMLASLSIGAGVDYAVHLLAAWKARDGGTLEDAAGYSSTLVGRAIWTNAVMVAAGFVILTRGEARPLQNVGALTAAAMIAAGLATFTVIPTLARKLRYDGRPMIDGIRPATATTREHAATTLPAHDTPG